MTGALGALALIAGSNISAAFRRGLASCCLVSACVPDGGVAELGVYPGVGTRRPFAEAGAGTLDAAQPWDATPDLTSELQYAPCSLRGCLTKLPAELSSSHTCFSLPVAAGLADLSRDVGLSIEIRPGADRYVNFTQRSFQASGAHIVSLQPISNEGVAVHDMKLYWHDGVFPEGLSEGRPSPRGLSLLYSWAKGVDRLFFEPVVGIPLEASGWLTLQIHYQYPEGAVMPSTLRDASGLRVCTASQVGFPVSFARLGSENFVGTSAQGTCTPALKRPIQLLAVRPQMNAYGTAAKLVLHRRRGDEEVLYDEPFAFGYDRTKLLEGVTIAPGDTLTSTCTYSQSTRSGPGAYDEVCELYVLHWPANTLVSDGSAEACLR